MITYCLKLIPQTHTNYCSRISKTRGFNRMWIVNNSVEVLKKIEECNERTVRNMQTFDFSTLYTSIPHKKLNRRMAKIINQCFKVSVVNTFVLARNRLVGADLVEAKNCWNATEVIKHVNYLMENIYVVCGGCLFRQVFGIPMGNDYAPFLANLSFTLTSANGCYKSSNRKISIF